MTVESSLNATRAFPNVESISGAGADLCLLAEHASERMPAGWSWPDPDRRLHGTHWSHDLGVAPLVRELAAALDAPATLADFTRLLVDPNRESSSPTLFREYADGPVLLNAHLDEEERARRIEACYLPYHDAVDAMLAECPAPICLSVHSFTPVYEGQARTLEVGVLFDTDDALGELALRCFQDVGFRAEANEPYSGKLGMAFSVERHAARHGRRPVELEVRQDLAVLPEERARVVQAIRLLVERLRR